MPIDLPASLQRKWHGAPLWVWYGGGAVLGGVGFIWWRRRKAIGQQASTADNWGVYQASLSGVGTPVGGYRGSTTGDNILPALEDAATPTESARKLVTPTTLVNASGSTFDTEKYSYALSGQDPRASTPVLGTTYVPGTTYAPPTSATDTSGITIPGKGAVPAGSAIQQVVTSWGAKLWDIITPSGEQYRVAA